VAYPDDSNFGLHWRLLQKHPHLENISIKLLEIFSQYNTHHSNIDHFQNRFPALINDIRLWKIPLGKIC
jgi:hypothetical protein